MAKKRSILRPIIIWHRHHSRPVLINFKWIILAGFALLTIILGSFGFKQAALSGNLTNGQNTGWMDLIFLSARLFSLQTANLVSSPPPALEIARFLALAITFCTITLIVTSSLYEHLAIFWIGNVKRRHAIVCGLGYLGPIITETLLDRGYSVVVIEKDKDNPELETIRDLGALVVIGDATSEETLTQAHLSTARCLFAVTGDDARNLAIYMKSDALLAKKSVQRAFSCYIHLGDRNLYRIYDSGNLGRFCSCGNTTVQPVEHKANGMQTLFFNLYWSAASCLLQQYPFIPSDRKAKLARNMEIPEPSALNSEPPLVNILVVGVGTFGESLILEAAFDWWCWYGHTGKTMNVTLLDVKAEEKMKALKSRYPSISQYCFFRPLAFDVLSSEATEARFLFNLDNTPRFSHIYICFDDEALSLTSAVHFRKLLGNGDVSIVFRTLRDELLNAFTKQHRENDPALQHLSAFPIASCECCMDEILFHGTSERLAMRIHQNYVNQELSAGKTKAENVNLVLWKDLTHEVRESNRRQASTFLNYLAHVGYTYEPLSDWNRPLTRFTHNEIEILAQEEHKNWLQTKQDLGYSLGLKDEEKKTHPCIMEWQPLPENEKDKDRDAVRAIPRLMAEIGQRVVKK